MTTPKPGFRITYGEDETEESLAETGWSSGDYAEMQGAVRLITTIIRTVQPQIAISALTTVLGHAIVHGAIEGKEGAVCDNVCTALKTSVQFAGLDNAKPAA